MTSGDTYLAQQDRVGRFQSRAQGVDYANVAACRFRWRALQGMKPGVRGAIYVKAICQRDEG
jgi:hypothetical protein